MQCTGTARAADGDGVWTDNGFNFIGSSTGSASFVSSLEEMVSSL